MKGELAIFSKGVLIAEKQNVKESDFKEQLVVAL